MEDFEIGRRRPLRKLFDNQTDPYSSLIDDLSDKDIARLLKSKEDKTPSSAKRKSIKENAGSNPNKVLPLIEIDLHIHELVDSTVGMDNYTMLQFQLDTVRKAMKAHRRRIGQKIVFIHGKGDGVLRKEVRTLLAKEYASCDVQDASFLKYGYGATQVTIRQT